jgi:hypothetical protein
VAFDFEEVDEATRKYMLDEVERDIAYGKLYLSKNFSATGKAAYPDLLRKAVTEGTEQTLTNALRYAGFWTFIKGQSSFASPRPLRPMRSLKSGPSGFGSAGSNLDQINNIAATFAEGEYNVYNMRGLCIKLIAEGQNKAEVYRAKAVDEPPQSRAVAPGSSPDPFIHSATRPHRRDLTRNDCGPHSHCEYVDERPGCRW